MTGTTTDGATPVQPAPPRAWQTRNVLLLLAAAVLAVVLAAAGGWYWVTHPQALLGYGDAQGGQAPRGRVFSEVMIFPRSDDEGPGHRTVLTVNSLRPRIEENTAGAVVVFLVCRTNVANPVLTLGATPESPASSCSQLHPLSGSERLAIDYPHTRIIAQITTSRAGRIHVAGYDITYRQGIRWGHQRVGIDSNFTIS